jgi:hypothetical protein
MDDIQRQSVRSSSRGASNSPDDRPSSRTPLSCAECSRRKIRCDKKILCRACFERGDSLSCRRQPVQKLPPRSAQRSATRKRSRQFDVYDELERVRERLDAVEALVGLTRGRSSATVTEDGHHLKENGLVSAMEEAALGIGENRR